MFSRHCALRAPRSALLPVALLFLAPLPCSAQDDSFAAGVRTTPWLNQEEERKLFKLPAGFEINLVVAEPDIQKPLNMAFDEKGRIWLTCTVEYPYAAPPDRPGKDTIRVLEDTDGDGRFEKVTTFADGLNIPMGIYPWKGGCVAFSIPNIWHFEDTDGDGVCDKRRVLYGPFDTSRDTHGMVNSFRRGWDGWVYACHGFNNDSHVKGTDGHEIHMQSGNTFRFQLDGSRIEHFTHGQVNPFGMCFDELFNIFTADCHSKPVYQLLRGGYYPSFGKPHDGLGFVPPMMDHTHSSTAICGLVKYSGENFPEEYRGDFYSGNVMTSRINRNKPEYHGSTIKAIEQPDFLVAGDPWFRPVDIQIGPDGALYVLDFYNRIIGHYEVPLPHPGRDRTSGRIWRISYKKTPGSLERGGEGSDSGAESQASMRRCRSMQMLAEQTVWSEEERRSAWEGLAGDDAFAARAAADALGRHPRASQVRNLFARLGKTPREDTHLRHTIRMAIRDHISDLSWPSTIDELLLSEADDRELASICLGAPNSASAAILLRYVETHDDNVGGYLQHAARFAATDALGDVVRVGKAKVGSDIEFQAQVIQSLANGLTQRGEPIAGQLQQWGMEVATALLAPAAAEHLPWTALPIDGLPASENPWVIAARPSRDGDKDSLFYYSLPKGEQRTGIYRSATFTIPEKLSFWCAGHSGIPNQALNQANYVRLRDAKTDEVLFQSRPPRNDTARQFNWDLSKHSGKQGYVELVDGDTANAYAWLAVGRFSYAPLNPGPEAGRQKLAAEIVGKLKLVSLRPQLASLVASSETESAARAAIGQALVALEPDSRAAALAAVLNDPAIPAELRPRMGHAITVRSESAYLENLREVMKRIPMRLQTTLAEILVGDIGGAELLLSLIESGHAAPRLLLAPNLSNKLAALKNPVFDERVSKITRALPSPNAVLDALITDRRRAFAKATTDSARGEAVFTKHCAACHQLEGKGTVLGPQLDGIGNRGIDRLLEDVLDPNRNVDVAFRTTTLRMTDGRVLSGLFRRVEGSQLILADAQGKEFSVPKSEIEEQQKTSLSLMPANVGEIVPADEFFDLMSYLLGKRTPRP